MVFSLMCAKQVLDTVDDILISYGDIIYEESVLSRILDFKDTAAVIVDDGWYEYWLERCDDPLDDVETLIYDANDCLVEIGKKTTEFEKVQSQYIGLMRFKKRVSKNYYLRLGKPKIERKKINHYGEQREYMTKCI